jgi:hypothetical protein
MFLNQNACISDTSLISSSFHLYGWAYSVHFFCPSLAVSLLGPNAFWSRDSQTPGRDTNVGHENRLMDFELSKKMMKPAAFCVLQFYCIQEKYS